MQEQIEHEIAPNGASLESALKQLWEKARVASDLIVSLRNEKKLLQEKIAELETVIAQTKSEGLVKEVELERLREDVKRLDVSSKSNGSINEAERIKLMEKIKSLIDKINSYLITSEG